ncbi:Alpha/Beta hydrolase protein [Bisporella sp. PMI_857]|nr:Alpha/Beta hydrolase protein [Bisporella sp. PMI_857]
MLGTVYCTAIWSIRDLNVPETFGFLHNQVTTFSILTPDRVSLHAWHVLPIGLYRRSQPSGFTRDITSRLKFKLLRDDPEARLVIYLHGIAGSIGSGWRPDNYRALYSCGPDKIHVVTIDYRGYGLSSSTPSEKGLLLDAMALTDWAINVAGIPDSRIVLFARSLGTAVGMSLIGHLAKLPSPINFSGIVFVASFSDVATLTAIYHISGVIPVLSPLAISPRLLAFFQTMIQKYHITFIHARDDVDIPWTYTEVLFWHAVNAALSTGISYEDLEQEKNKKRVDLGDGGWSMEWRTSKGLIRERILDFGLYDKIMSYPAISMATIDAF